MPVGLSTSTVEIKVDNEVMHVTLNRPQHMNALSQELVKELTDVFDKLDREKHKDAFPEVRAVVLRGAGGNFCGGGDVKEMAMLVKQSHSGDVDVIASYNTGAGILFRAIESASVPVIAVVEGVALGGGLGLACAVDITVSKKDVVFGLPETSLGLIPAQVAPVIRRRVGESQARVMALIGGKFDVLKAERAGVVHYVANDDQDLEKTVEDLLRKIKACAPNAVTCAKQLMTETSPIANLSPEELGMLFARQMASAEGKEGTTAFVEKRKPAWCK